MNEWNSAYDELSYPNEQRLGHQYTWSGNDHISLEQKSRYRINVRVHFNSNVYWNRWDCLNGAEFQCLSTAIMCITVCLASIIDGFIVYSGYFYSVSSSPLLLRGAPDTGWILCRSFTPKRHRQLRVKDLPKVPTWRLERDSKPRPFGRKATNLPMSHHAPHHSCSWCNCIWYGYWFNRLQKSFSITGRVFLLCFLHQSLILMTKA